MGRFTRIAYLLIVGLLASPALRAGAPDPLPSAQATDLWLAPVTESGSKTPLAAAVEMIASGRAATALPLLSRPPADPLLGGYVLLYEGRAALAASRPADAAAFAKQLLAGHRSGYLNEAALSLSAEVAETLADWPTAQRSLQT